MMNSAHKHQWPRRKNHQNIKCKGDPKRTAFVPAHQGARPHPHGPPAQSSRPRLRFDAVRALPQAQLMAQAISAIDEDRTVAVH